MSALRTAGRADEAEALLGSVSDRITSALAARPDSPKLLNSRAWLAARTRTGLDAGLTAAERAVELAPSNAALLDTLAEVRFQSGDRAGAIEAGSRALDLAPEREYLKRQLVRFASGDHATPPPVELD